MPGARSRPAAGAHSLTTCLLRHVLTLPRRSPAVGCRDFRTPFDAPALSIRGRERRGARARQITRAARPPPGPSRTPRGSGRVVLGASPRPDCACAGCRPTTSGPLAPGGDLTAPRTSRGSHPARHRRRGEHCWVKSGGREHRSRIPRPSRTRLRHARAGVDPCSAPTPSREGSKPTSTRAGEPPSSVLPRRHLREPRLRSQRLPLPSPPPSAHASCTQAPASLASRRLPLRWRGRLPLTIGPRELQPHSPPALRSLDASPGSASPPDQGLPLRCRRTVSLGARATRAPRACSLAPVPARGSASAELRLACSTSRAPPRLLADAAIGLASNRSGTAADGRPRTADSCWLHSPQGQTRGGAGTVRYLDDCELRSPSLPRSPRIRLLA
ncbi:hypothetical protein SAMN02745121_01631 [Nannocystis exedens]|uniref:Uncharacterized protein n=1 Tax=Nannocystis exedens TaxID=54 RepID=A0A1I1VEC1_9BACT|nr:hypothetical protein NAEX_05534 [Nannocystis exedens]SFD79443.1 hypothetical protein SAMN02745121_01631 [Nannocystis exedens]